MVLFVPNWIGKRENMDSMVSIYCHDSHGNKSLDEIPDGIVVLDCSNGMKGVRFDDIVEQQRVEIERLNMTINNMIAERVSMALMS